MVENRHTCAEEQLHGIRSQRPGHERLGCGDLMLASVMCAAVHVNGLIRLGQRSTWRQLHGSDAGTAHFGRGKACDALMQLSDGFCKPLIGLLPPVVFVAGPTQHVSAGKPTHTPYLRSFRKEQGRS